MVSEVQSIPTISWGFCPFRGLPKVSLDSRCPSTVPCYEDAVETREFKGLDNSPEAPKRKRGRPRKDEVREIIQPQKEIIGHFIPIVREDTYCHECLNKKIREKEMGIKVSDRKLISVKRGRGRPRKVR